MEESKNQERPSHCSCGTQLVENAAFCHICGKPVFEIPEPEIPVSTPFPSSAAVQAPPPSVPPAARYNGPPEPIDLRNRLAVQVAFFVAVFEFPLVSLSPLIPISPMVVSALVLGLGGFAAAYLYQQRTDSQLGALNGFRLGWISGLLFFLLVLVFGALQFAFFTFSGGNLMGQLEQMLAASGASAMPPEQQQILREVFTDWTKLFILMLIGLFLLFLFFTACAGVGGALGARSRVRQQNSKEQASR